MAGDTNKLRSLLTTLPQELYDQIYEETFTATPAFQVISKDQNDKSRFIAKSQLHLLTVDRASRAKFMPSYYANTTFIVYTIETCIQWASSMPLEYFKLITDIRCVFERGSPPGTTWCAERLRNLWRRSGENHLHLASMYVDMHYSSHTREPYLPGPHLREVTKVGYESDVTEGIEGFSMQRTASPEA